MKESTVDKLIALLERCEAEARAAGQPGLKVAFGLRAQGHLPTILDMLDQQKSWAEIGQVIGWDPETARLWFRREVLQDQAG
jgi:hypothetical protein